MYDVRGPTLVFTTQTHNPVTEQHTGYIFRLYDAHFDKPREFFFSNIFEATIMAAHWGADLLTNERSAPDRLCAEDYAANILDESAFMKGPPDGRSSGRARYLAKLRMEKYNETRDMQPVEHKELQELEKEFGYMADIDFMGEPA